MNKRTVFFTYTILSLLLILSAVFLGLQAKHYLHARTIDPLDEIRKHEPNEAEVENRIEAQERQERRDTVLTFNQTNSFVALATPIPKPTPTPVPPPSPTPITPAKNWKINFATKSMASIKSYEGKDHIVSIGDVLKDSVFGDFKVVGIEGEGFSKKTIKVQHVQSGTIGYIQDYVKGK